MHSSPMLADIDHDGFLEVILGTSMGFIYVLDPNNGEIREGFPLQMGEIQAQVGVNDVDGDGYLDLVACDTQGSIAAFNKDGHELWERHLGSLIGQVRHGFWAWYWKSVPKGKGCAAYAQGPSFGDVDGDGSLEVVVVTSAGGVHALNARTGKAKFHIRQVSIRRLAFVLLKDLRAKKKMLAPDAERGGA